MRALFFVSFLAAFVASNAFSQSGKFLQEAFELIHSEEVGYRKLGWLSLSKILKDADPPEETAAKLESLALKESSPESLTALNALYQRVESLRFRRIEAVEEKKPEDVVRFYLAALAQIESGRLPSKVAWGEGVLSDEEWRANEWRVLARMLLIGIEAGTGKYFSSGQVKEILAGPNGHLAALLIDKEPDVSEEKILGKNARQVVFDALGRCVTSSLNDVRRVFQSICSQRIRTRLDADFEAIDLESLIRKTDVDSLDGEAKAPETLPLEMKLNLDDDSIVKNGDIELTPKKLGLYGFDPEAAAPPEFRDKYRKEEGAYFCEVPSSERPDQQRNFCKWIPFRKILSPKDTPGVPVYSLGMDSRFQTWEGGQVKARMSLKTSLVPAPDTNWIAVRWHSRGVANLKTEKPNEPLSATNKPAPEFVFPEAEILCESGCLWKKSEIREPVTGWTIFSVIPNAPVQFSLSFKPPQGVVAKTYAYGDAGYGQSQFQILEMSSANVSAFPAMDVRDLFSRAPEKRPHNPLLTYVAALQAEARRGGWLAPEAGSDTAAALSIARLALLARLMEFEPAERNDLPREAEIAWKEKQGFLKRALTSMIFRSNATFKSALENGVARGYAVDMALRPIERKIFSGLEAMESLSSAQAYALLGFATKPLQVKNTKIIDDKKKLVTAIFGAHEELIELSKRTQERLTSSCLLLKKLRLDKHGAVAASVIDPQIEVLCDDILSPAN